MSVKEDSHTLFGFISKIEREIFRLLISVSGVGPSIARTMLSSMTTDEIQNANLNIGYNQERIFILKYCLLEKAVYEIGYELNSRPRWALIPLKGISNIINH